MIVAIAITIATPPAVRPSPSAVSSTARTSWPLSGCRGSGGSPSAMPPARSAAVTRARKGWSLSTSTPTITVAMQARSTTNGQVSAAAAAKSVPCMTRVVGVARGYWQPPLAPGSLAGRSPRACAPGLLWPRRLEVGRVVVPGGRSGQPVASIKAPGASPGTAGRWAIPRAMPIRLPCRSACTRSFGPAESIGAAGHSPRACALGLLWPWMLCWQDHQGWPGIATAAGSLVHVYDRRGGKAVEVRAARR